MDKFIQVDTMFGVDFYPTPPVMIARLIDGIKWDEVDTVLEPEAGKADLAKAVKSAVEAAWNSWNRRTVDIDCIEIDANLRHIITGEGFRVVHDDFLTFSTHKHYRLIVMNPPFSDGDRHLLKALHMQARGGKIRCLLNAETIRNPYTNTRKALAKTLEQVGAEIEYINEGFVDGERRTDVEVALVRVDIPYADSSSVILEDMRKARESADLPPVGNSMVHGDIVTGMVEQYNFEAEAGLKLINEWRRLRPHILDRIAEEYQKPILKLTVQEGSHSDEATGNGYIAQLRKKYWEALFADPRFTGMLTSDLREQYMRKVAELTGYEFSEWNIRTVRMQFSANVLAGIDKAIIDLFDALSWQNTWHKEMANDNIHYFDGWATNKAWKINHKVIRPSYMLQKDKWDKQPRLSWNSDGMNEISDIEKVFRYLDGKPIDGAEAAGIVERAVQRGRSAGIETEYFTVTLYLKGTCHIKFSNLDLLKKFNLYGSRSKKWLPPTYGRTAYADMSDTERAVVDSFEGEAEYAKTVARGDWYLMGAEQMLTAATTLPSTEVRQLTGSVQ